MKMMVGAFLMLVGMGLGVLAINVTSPGEEYVLLMSAIVCCGAQVAYGLYQVVRHIIAGRPARLSASTTT